MKGKYEQLATMKWRQGALETMIGSIRDNEREIRTLDTIKQKQGALETMKGKQGALETMKGKQGALDTMK